MAVYRWDELEEAELNPLVRGRVLAVPHAMVARITAPTGKSINMHRHDFDQVTIMLRGRMLWHIDGEATREVGPGHVMLMEAGVAHGGEVLEEAEYIDVFAPPRQDFSWHAQRLAATDDAGPSDARGRPNEPSGEQAGDGDQDAHRDQDR